MRGICTTILLLPFLLFAQGDGDSLITIKGKVVDTSATIGFYDLVVLNHTVGKGIFGKYDGTFTITVQKKDVVGISVVGYQSIKFSFADSSYKQNYAVEFYLQPLEFTGNEVIVRPLKTLDQLKEERANIAKREVPTVTVTNAIQSPITALYMAFSKREKTKRKVAEMEYIDQQEDVVKEILRLYVHNDIIDLREDEFDEFVTFLNLNTDFLKYASDYELIVYIKNKFEHFMLIKRDGF